MFLAGAYAVVTNLTVLLSIDRRVMMLVFSLGSFTATVLFRFTTDSTTKNTPTRRVLRLHSSSLTDSTTKATSGEVCLRLTLKLNDVFHWFVCVCVCVCAFCLS